MSNLIATITEDVNVSTITSSLTDLVPYIVMIVPVALGIYLLRKLIKGTAKGKVRF